LFSSKPDRAFAAGIALLVPSFTATPACATDAAVLDEATLRQSAAPAIHEDRAPNEKASRRLSEPDRQDDKHADIAQIARPPETELRTTMPELPLGMNIRPTESSRLPDSATNLVFSGTVTRSGATLP